MTILLLFDHGCLAQRDRIFLSRVLLASIIYLVVHLSLYASSTLLVCFGERREGENVCVGRYHWGHWRGGGIGKDPLGLALDYDVSLEEDIIVQLEKNTICESLSCLVFHFKFEVDQPPNLSSLLHQLARDSEGNN